MVSINPNFGTNGAGGANKAPRAGKTLDQYIPQPGKTDIEPSVTISVDNKGKTHVTYENDGDPTVYLRYQNAEGVWGEKSVYTGDHFGKPV